MIEAACPGPSDSGMPGSRTGILKNVTLLVFGSRIGMLSVAYSGDPKSGPLALTVGLRLSDEIRSCRYLSGVLHSHSVMTRLRSTPCGRGGFSAGSSPLATRSVQSPRYLNGAPPQLPASWLVIASPAWPDCTRRIHASAPESKWPNCAGIVRVAARPIWWHPMQPMFFSCLSQSSWVIFAGIPLSVLPKSLFGGIFLIAYQ